MPFIDLGKRNKPTFWEYGSAFSFLHVKLPRTKYDIKLFLGVGKGDANSHCHHSDVIAENKKIMIEEFLAGNYNQSFFDLQTALYVDEFEKLKVLMQTNFFEDDNQTLAQKFYDATYQICCGHKPMLHALFTQYLDDFFVEHLKKMITPEEANDISKIQEYTSILLTTTKTSFAEQEDDLIQEIERLYFVNHSNKSKEDFSLFIKSSEIAEKIDMLVNDFGWFHMEYMREPFTREEYIDYIWKRVDADMEVSKENSIQRRQKIIEAQSKWFDERKDVPGIEAFKKIVFGFQEFAYILDHSKVVTVQGIYVARPLFGEVAKRLDISLPNMLFLALPEVVGLLKAHGKADPHLIAQRKECRVVLLKDGIISVYEGDKAKKMADELLPENKIENIKEVKGIVGYPRLVRGKVTVVASIKDRDKFKKGDVLVTHDGTAELTIFLREASAIVTDEGGMICHSTIVAREMKTPCVVGTRIATKIFKDGDMVEVDAVKGIVKII